VPPDLHRFTTAAAHRAAPSVPTKAQPADALLTADVAWAEMKHSWFNEDPNGLPTHFPTIAPHWSWLPDEVTLVTGWPGHGKSELMLQLMLTKSVYDSWKWALYVPENMPARRALNKLVQSYVGRTTNPKYTRMSFSQYEEAAHWILQHFHLINPRRASSLDELLPVLQHAATTHQVNGCLIDPFNALSSNLNQYGGREDEMLKSQLNDLLDFAEDHHQCVVVCAHPSGTARTQDKEMNLKVPDQYSVSGGRMWANKVDNFLVVHRPYADDDPTNTAVDFYARKIKQEGLVGMKTPKEGVRLSYERGTSRYIDPKIGHAPLDVKAVQNYRQHGTNDPLPPTQGTVPLRTSSHSEFTDHWTPNGKAITLPSPSPDA
jgi:hypothetical protein